MKVVVRKKAFQKRDNTHTIIVHLHSEYIYISTHREVYIILNSPKKLTEGSLELLVFPRRVTLIGFLAKGARRTRGSRK